MFTQCTSRILNSFDRCMVHQRYTTAFTSKVLPVLVGSSTYLQQLHYFSTVFHVSPKGETSITDYDETHVPPQRQFVSAHVQDNVPLNDYYNGHLLYDQLEYVNDTISKIEDSVNVLEDINARKRNAMTKTIGFMNDTNRNEMKRLFDESATTKIALKRQLHDMKAALRSYKESNYPNRKSFAVDAPDGLSDDCIQNEMEEVQNILRNTPTIEERAAAMQALIVQSRNGVDAPDGTCDAITKEELEVIQYILNNSKKIPK